jgi:hypothetical protein
VALVGLLVIIGAGIGGAISGARDFEEHGGEEGASVDWMAGPTGVDTDAGL